MTSSDSQQAGEQVIITGQKLVDTGQRLDNSSVQMLFASEQLGQQHVAQSLESVETGTNSIRNLLAPVVTALRRIASGMRSITIPTITPQYRSVSFPVVGNVRFVTGITTGSTSPFSSIANDLDGVANDVDNVRTALQTICGAIAGLRTNISTIQANINQAANETKAAGSLLAESGTTLQQAGRLIASNRELADRVTDSVSGQVNRIRRDRPSPPR